MNFIKDFTPKYGKVVIFLVDALRYDFVSENNTHVYSGNAMKFVQNILRTEKNNSALRKFIPDPPTVTAQRIYGLSTGTIPSLISIKDNFDASLVTEDSMINQFYKHNKR